MLHFTALQAIAAVIIVLFAQTFITDGTPFKRRKRSAPVAEFAMPQQAYSNYPWTVPNEHLSQKKQTSQEQFLAGYTECPKQILNGSDVPTYMRSNCPWYYLADHDPARFPTTILKAKSPCRFCIGSNETMECVAIFKEIEILQQGGIDSTGNMIFTEANTTISVGYTCSESRTEANNQTTTQPDVDPQQ